MRKKIKYHQYTDFDKEPGGLRKLDFIVKILEKHFSGKNKSEIRILDVGCGNGNLALPLASLGYKILGIDADGATIESLRKKNRFSNAEFRVFDASHKSPLIPLFQRGTEGDLERDSGSLPFSKGELERDFKFDCIIASEFFEHLENPEGFAKKVREVLHNDGLLIASIPNGTSFLENIRWFLNRTGVGRGLKKFLRKTILRREKIQTQADSPHIQFFTLRKFKKILSSAGFKIQEIKNTSVIFGETFYLFWRFFLPRNSWLFHCMDNCDNKLSDIFPKTMGVGWVVICKK